MNMQLTKIKKQTGFDQSSLAEYMIKKHGKLVFVGGFGNPGKLDEIPEKKQKLNKMETFERKFQFNSILRTFNSRFRNKHKRQLSTVNFDSKTSKSKFKLPYIKKLSKNNSASNFKTFNKTHQYFMSNNINRKNSSFNDTSNYIESFSNNLANTNNTLDGYINNSNTTSSNNKNLGRHNSDNMIFLFNEGKLVVADKKNYELNNKIFDEDKKGPYMQYITGFNKSKILDELKQNNHFFKNKKIEHRLMKVNLEFFLKRNLIFNNVSKNHVRYRPKEQPSEKSVRTIVRKINLKKLS